MITPYTVISVPSLNMTVRSYLTSIMKFAKLLHMILSKTVRSPSWSFDALKNYSILSLLAFSVLWNKSAHHSYSLLFHTDPPIRCSVSETFPVLVPHKHSRQLESASFPQTSEYLLPSLLFCRMVSVVHSVLRIIFAFMMIPFFSESNSLKFDARACSHKTIAI